MNEGEKYGLIMDIVVQGAAAKARHGKQFGDKFIVVVPHYVTREEIEELQRHPSLVNFTLRHPNDFKENEDDGQETEAGDRDHQSQDGPDRSEHDRPSSSAPDDDAPGGTSSSG